MGKIDTTQTIKVTPKNEEDVQKVWNFLTKNVSFDLKGEWIDIYKDSYIEGNERVTGYYEPEVRYTRNGDGHPAFWELDCGIDAEWLEDEIKEKIGVDCRVDCELDDRGEGD